MASQNIYDNDFFFNNYSQFSSAKNGIEKVHEWPYLKAMIGNISGLNILDLGCGEGAFARESIKQGANFVLGIDLSENMIKRAREINIECEKEDKSFQKLKYEIQDLESIDLENEKYDLVFSRFVIHYIVDLESLFIAIFKSLKSGGSFIFTIEHPFKSCPKSFSGLYNINDEKGGPNLIWPVADYEDEGLRVRNWLGMDNVYKQHRTISTYINTLIKCGFTIDSIIEKPPSKDQLQNIGTNYGLDRNFILILKVSKIN